MENPKSQVLERLKQANNVLVTVSSNPSVDQLAAAIGFSLFLNKQGKHATAVFSGQAPSTIEFLKPEKTLEKNTDSLRDFIISLDKSKADKLRYKVEEDHVRIFITPYRTSISEQDLQFSQGDFNVDAVVALGVKEQKELDQAITAHGRILHDATVVSVNTSSGSELGTINWTDADASSLCEMLVSICDGLQANSLDGQMATAFLTGIVAETERFSNQKTTSVTMSASAKLMAAGANQQLVANELQKQEQPAAAPVPPLTPDPVPEQAPTQPQSKKDSSDGTLEIGHEDTPLEPEPTPLPEPEPSLSQIHIDDDGRFLEPDLLAQKQAQDKPVPVEDKTDEGRHLLTDEPPELGGILTANTQPEGLDPSSDALSLPPVGGRLLSHDAPAATPKHHDTPLFAEAVESTPSGAVPSQLEAPVTPGVTDVHQPSDAEQVESETHDENDTLAALERAVDSPHVTQQTSQSQDEPAHAPITTTESDNLDEARNAVLQAISDGSTEQPLPPIEALNAQPIDLNLDHQVEAAPQPTAEPDYSLPPGLIPDVPATETAPPLGQAAPPPVPPPMMPPMPGLELPGVQLPQDQAAQPPANAPSNNPFNLPPA